MIRNPVSFNEATRGHTRRGIRPPGAEASDRAGGITEYRCDGCSWRHEKSGGAKAFDAHLYDVWKRARDAT